MSEKSDTPVGETVTNTMYEVWYKDGFWFEEVSLDTLNGARKMVREWKAEDAASDDAERYKYRIIKVTTTEVREVRR